MSSLWFVSAYAWFQDTTERKRKTKREIEENRKKGVLLLCFFDRTKKGGKARAYRGGRKSDKERECVCTCVIVRAAIRWIMMEVAKEKR